MLCSLIVWVAIQCNDHDTDDTNHDDTQYITQYIQKQIAHHCYETRLQPSAQPAIPGTLLGRLAPQRR